MSDPRKKAIDYQSPQTREEQRSRDGIGFLTALLVSILAVIALFIGFGFFHSWRMRDF